MNKQELIKALDGFSDDANVVISFDIRNIVMNTKGLDYVAYGINCVDDGWKPSNVVDIQMGDLIMG